MSQAVSSRYYPALVQSHDVAMQFSVFTAGMGGLLYQSPVLVNPGTVVNYSSAPVPVVTAGSVTLQKGVDQRSTFTMTITDPTGLLVSQGILAPFGNEIQISYGICYNAAKSDYEMILLGTFRITDVSAVDAGKGQVVTVSGQDRSRIVARREVVIYYQTAANQNYTDAIRDIATYCYPGVLFNDTAINWRAVPPQGIGISVGGPPNTILTPSVYGITYQQGDDLWTEARNMAASLTCDLYFDRHGVLTLIQDPNLNYMNGTLATIAQPVFNFVEGANCTMTQATLKLSDANGYNQWIVTGEGQVIGYTQAPLQSSLVQDNDPTSPTYVNGPYGFVTGFQSNELMVTQAQINLYAQFMLANSIGKQQQITISAFPDPALDLDDPISVTRAGLGVTNQAFVISELQIPFDVKSTMTVTTRQRRALTYPAI